MSATRLLILGVLLSKPLHGYEVRRELETWGADSWANIAFGSIYHALSKLYGEGMLEIVDAAPDGSRTARTVYQITDAGRTEFERLLRDAWAEVKPLVDPFQVPLTFMDRLSREELIAALRRRLTLLRASKEILSYAADAKVRHRGTPRHLSTTMGLAIGHVQVELDWIEDAIGQVERGELP